MAETDDPVGEIWFEAGAAPELLVKYLFTSAKLSVQVHPSDDDAQARGHARGKEECWLILDTEPDAAIGIGLRDTMSEHDLRGAALDGSIEEKLDWKPVSPGDIFYLPAGTIHAIGAGVTLLEVQQNIDLTYRLYDYGRPRELHVDDAVAVAHRGPWFAPSAPGEVGTGREILASGRAFTLERWTGAHASKLAMEDSGPVWLIPLDGAGSVDAQAIAPGEVWMADGTAQLDYSGTLLAAYARSSVVEGLFASR
ncbi:phosphoheptose isomerase [Parasphingopyxis sp. CP4]|nr:phosphoheptose isomerase [Parasphingopyxis sp. CP4]